MSLDDFSAVEIKYVIKLLLHKKRQDQVLSMRAMKIMMGGETNIIAQNVVEKLIKMGYVEEINTAVRYSTHKIDFGSLFKDFIKCSFFKEFEDMIHQYKWFFAK